MDRRLWGLACLCLAAAFGCDAGVNARANTIPGGAWPPVPELGYFPEGAVCLEGAAISNFEYPLSRPLFVYIDRNALKRPEVAAFVRFYVSDEGQRLLQVKDYSPLSADDLKATRDTLEAALAEAGVSAGGKLSGMFKIDGSSTVFPVSQAIAETFMKANPKVNVTVNYTGTGTGFKMLAGGEIEISDASRPIKDQELSLARAHNVEPLELKIGIDGLAIVVHPQNTWVEGLTIEHLRKIWEQSSTVKTWRDLDPAWPAEPLVLCGPGTESGTYDYFVEAVLEGHKTHTNYQSSPNDNTTVNIVAGNRHALGYFSYAYYIENQDKVKALCISK